MFIVDRIEEGLAVIYDDNGKHFNININHINGSVRDGAVVYNDNDIWFVDEVETQKRMDKARTRLNRLFS